MNGRRLREAMQRGLVQAPGCADSLEAMLIEEAGFEALYLSGFALSASLLGEPDLGLIGLDDVTGATRRITAAVDIPVIVDIDTGFGGPLNIRRTVVEVEAAGASAVQIEDQLAPKRCGHFEDKTIVEFDEADERVRIAVESRRSEGWSSPAPTPLAFAGSTRPSNAGGRSLPWALTSCSLKPSRASTSSLRSPPRCHRRRWCTTPSRARAPRYSNAPRWLVRACASCFTR